MTVMTKEQIEALLNNDPGVLGQIARDALNTALALHQQLADAEARLAAAEAQVGALAEARYPHPGYGKPYPISTVLRDLASQEGCDGEPFDAMIFAADAIDAALASAQGVKHD